MPDPTTPTGAPARVTADRPRTATPAAVEREVWRELASQKEVIKSTADTAKRTHSIVINMAGDISTLKDESRRTAEFSSRLVDLAQRREDRASREEAAAAAAVEREEARRAEMEAARASMTARTLGKLTDWWVENWRTIALAVALLLGLNVQPLLQAFGIMAAAPAPTVTTAAIEAPAPSPEPAPAIAVEPPAMSPAMSIEASPPPPAPAVERTMVASPVERIEATPVPVEVFEPEPETAMPETFEAVEAAEPFEGEAFDSEGREP